MVQTDDGNTRKALRRARPVSRLKRAAEDGRVLDVTVVLLRACLSSSMIAPAEVFRAAGCLWNRLHGEPSEPRFRVRVASLDGRGVEGRRAVLRSDCAIGDVKETDIIVLPPLGWDAADRIEGDSALLAWLREHHARGAYIASICTSVILLAEAGLLDGRTATAHWGVVERLSQRYPNVRWQPELFVTEDDRLICGAGVYAATDLSLYLVEKFCGREIALQCAKSLLLRMPRNRDAGYAILPLSRPHDDEKIRQAEDYLRGHFDTDVSIENLASRAGMSPRNFIRRFKAATGRLPGAYVQALRITIAKELLERGHLPVQAICTKVGYADAAFFRALFKRHTGMTPTQYRSTYAGMDFDSGETLPDRIA
jgi:transcriptional regulator GlxA family with amidase domain